MRARYDRLRRRASSLERTSWIQGAVSAAIVVGAVLFTLRHLQPGWIATDTTPAGGDMGAHVWGPAYLRDVLLPSGRLAGWTPDWYAGFPAFHFYMVVPSLAIVVLDLVLPYGVAFKLITVSGLLSLPVSAWALGRLARLPFPGPPLLAVAGVVFLFDRSFTIYGGNIASTLAGEFAFSISLSLAVLFLGVVLRGLDTGRHRALAAGLLALCALCHVIPAIFALLAVAVALLVRAAPTRVPAALSATGATVVLGLLALVVPVVGVLAAVAAVAALLLWAGPARVRWALPTLVVGGALTGFWTVPFVLRRAYLNDMGWEKLTTYWEHLLPGRIGDAITRSAGGEATVELNGADLTVWIALALVGALVSVLLGRRLGIFLTVLAGVFAVAFVLAPQGRLWNARLLPFWYLALYLLAAIAVAEVVLSIATLVARRPERPVLGVVVGAPVALALAAAVTLALPLRSLPFGEATADGASYAWGPLSTTDRSFIPDWARWNYSGYEEKDAYPEYRAIVDTMAAVGEDRGCGRAMWEYEPSLDRHGTPMALMLLPYFTDRCIGSMEGLYFEASATTPYHFLNQAELSDTPSSAQRDLPYAPEVDVAAGVRHLQLLGVRYYMAFSDAAVAQAQALPDVLTEVASTGPHPHPERGEVTWRVYEVADAALVEGLEAEPAVLTGVPEGGEGWLEPAVDWYVEPARWEVALAAAGPSSWQRVAEGATPSRRGAAPVQVSGIESGTDSITFDVDQVGVPVLVKASYFPNWEVEGADGPWRVAPNLMVVTPTSTHVELHYGTTSVEWLAWLLTLLGLAGLVVLARMPQVVMPAERERRARVEPSDGLDERPSDGFDGLDGLDVAERVGDGRVPVPAAVSAHRWADALPNDALPDGDLADGDLADDDGGDDAVDALRSEVAREAEPLHQR